jgi:hypothetical protein
MLFCEKKRNVIARKERKERVIVPFTAYNITVKRGSAQAQARMILIPKHNDATRLALAQSFGKVVYGMFTNSDNMVLILGIRL